MKCPFGMGYENDCMFEGNQKELIHHLMEKEDKYRLAFKLAEMIAAEGETIPKSKIEAKIAELEKDRERLNMETSDTVYEFANEEKIEVLKQLLNDG